MYRTQCCNNSKSYFPYTFNRTSLEISLGAFKECPYYVFQISPLSNYNRYLSLSLSLIIFSLSLKSVVNLLFSDVPVNLQAQLVDSDVKYEIHV